MNLGYHSITFEAAEAAHKAYGFNCGPGALCGITGLSPEQLRPHLGDFEAKGYMNPSLMRETLKRLGLEFRWHVLSEQSARVEMLSKPSGSGAICSAKAAALLPNFGLCRIQWGGPWCDPGVPMAARYRQSHWIAAAHHPGRGLGVFDVNNNTSDHDIDWAPFDAWASVVVPDLIATYPRADGTWWLTHVVEVKR